VVNAPGNARQVVVKFPNQGIDKKPVFVETTVKAIARGERTATGRREENLRYVFFASSESESKDRETMLTG
jgi:hypothetical protein